ncbi:hypothetical protein G6F62_015694 [Rhizopus arrhizus]|uniref:Uncharacterized protein n=1 Tax=Rhizopus delemar TaxID=936053 RepID=A0A9P6XN45_9FUNG|nr:hypothetical protein G6F66_014298 [Rhizopus arrhizus]KAG1304612.1 hypothetical protein G6F62_015694 [Rhizopus arrhizus]KAG1387121.1 hypothetical protein G6F59_016550 [Rhizopus arrhizus]KAG1527747.1 hypothetical protein G6F50_018286 [Rhizopus delemar]
MPSQRRPWPCVRRNPPRRTWSRHAEHLPDPCPRGHARPRTGKQRRADRRRPHRRYRSRWREGRPGDRPARPDADARADRPALRRH